MTNYAKWDKKATAITREVEQEDIREKMQNDAALGLSGGPAGPPTAKAKQQLGELEHHSEEKKAIIESMESREVNFSCGPQEEPFVLQEVDHKGVRLQDSQECTFVIPANAGVLKVFIERCQNCRIRLEGKVRTSSVEVWKCQGLVIEVQQSLGMLQIDECLGPVQIVYSSQEHFGDIYHQNVPGLSAGWGEASWSIGRASQVQHVTRLSGATEAEPLCTVEVSRNKNDFPLTVPTPKYCGQPEQEPPPASDKNREVASVQAREMKEKGNSAFRASDFMQAAAYYSQALDLDSCAHTVWANRAQCWLKLGNHEKALADAIRCTEICPEYAKGWFRKGISLHAIGRYAQAIPALLEAEKLDPKNKQVADAVRMAQLMARKLGGAGP